MKQLLRLLALFVPFALSAQDGPRFVEERIAEERTKRADFIPVRLLTLERASPGNTALWTDALRAAAVLRFDAVAAGRLMAASPERIAFELPTAGSVEVLDLVRADIFASGFQVTVSSTNTRTDVGFGLHYRGVLRGAPGTLVAVSVFPDHVMALIGEANGERVLGPFEGDDQRRHVLYHERDLKGSPGFSCGVSDERVQGYSREELRLAASPKTIRCVNLYWESAYDLFVNKGSVANVTTYLTGLFNQMATLFANDGINVQLSEIYVWNTTSPYNANSSSGRLNQFGAERTSFNGNLAHLIDLGGYGGVAWLNSLCGGTSSRMAYSGINTSYSSVPTYSWSVEVVTHETGHNLGSRHTHACAWNGDNTAIDGCGPAAGYSEGSCPQGPLPSSSVGGTIMSYCHLTSSTIKFANGFGPQPKAVIVNRVNAASCLAQCGTSCDPPLPLSVSNLTAIGATLGWANFGVGSYTLRWKPTSGSTWTTVTGLTGTTYNLTGLTQSTQYEFQVLSVCSSSSSAYSASTVFTTPVPCTDNYEPNNSTGAATVLALPASINGLINPSGDADYFRFTLSGNSTVNIFLGNLPADYNVRLLNSGGTQIASSSNGGTTSESINYANAAAGTYYVHVFGYNGASNISVCYALSVSAYAAECPFQGLFVNNITYNSGVANWSPPPGSQGSTYELRWRPVGSQTWTTAAGLTATSHTMSPLLPLTTYDVEVRAFCGGAQGISSAWVGLQFTTLEAPCDVVPRSVVAARVFLEGPYKTANNLMADSLRKLNLIPLNEPYTGLGHSVSGPTAFLPGLLATTGSNAIVDWVLVEVRSNSSPFTVLEARVGLVQRDGDVVAPDGSSPLGFCTAAGTYRVAVRHRNHLGVMTGSGFALSGASTTVDLTLAGTSTFGTNARRVLGSIMALWAGNADVNDRLSYVGDPNDRDPILVLLGGSVPTNTNGPVYHVCDVNLDGTIKYVGESNDRDPILTNIGGSTPTNILLQQLP